MTGKAGGVDMKYNEIRNPKEYGNIHKCECTTKRKTIKGLRQLRTALRSGRPQPLCATGPWGHPHMPNQGWTQVSVMHFLYPILFTAPRPARTGKKKHCISVQIYKQTERVTSRPELTKIIQPPWIKYQPVASQTTSSVPQEEDNRRVAAGQCVKCVK